MRAPKCRKWKYGKHTEIQGYKGSQLEKYLKSVGGQKMLDKFNHWMRGQTVSETPDHKDWICYAIDWERFVRGWEPLD